MANISSLPAVVSKSFVRLTAELRSTYSTLLRFTIGNAQMLY